MRILAAGIGSPEASFIFEPGIEVILVLSGLGVSVLVHELNFGVGGMDRTSTCPAFPAQLSGCFIAFSLVGDHPGIRLPDGDQFGLIKVKRQRSSAKTSLSVSAYL